MLNITKKADYGLLFLQLLSSAKADEYIPLRSIATTADLPYKFLSQIAGELKTGGIVESKEGLGGGYRLKKAASKIKISDIFVLLDGPVAPMSCLRGHACCREATCPHRPILTKLAAIVTDTLASYSLADLSPKIS